MLIVERVPAFEVMPSCCMQQSPTCGFKLAPRAPSCFAVHRRRCRRPPCPQHLEASVRRSNPGVDLGVMLVRGELGAAATQRLMGFNVTVIYVEPLLPEERGAAGLQRG